MPLLLPNPSIHQRRRCAHRYEHRRKQREKAAVGGSHSPYTRPYAPSTIRGTASCPWSAPTSMLGPRTPLRPGVDRLAKGDAAWPALDVGRAEEEQGSSYTLGRAIIVDAKGRIIAILLGRLDDPDWDAVVRAAAKAMKRARRAGEESRAFSAADREHRRGGFTILATGVSFRGGQTGT
ncbi:hypothetical protein B0H13DRAFT_2339694 [Mycena leptocephala]|nr:hypothetical protein B0H13DRAFT_2339694 [Mycena leptocephala]